jgi:hypothetical protein
MYLPERQIILPANISQVYFRHTESSSGNSQTIWCGVASPLQIWLFIYFIIFFFFFVNASLAEVLRINIDKFPVYFIWGVEGTSAGSGPWSSHCREAMALARVGPGMGRTIGVTTEGWWLRSNKSAATFPSGNKCVIRSLFSPKAVCAWRRAITYERWHCAEHSGSKE